jgi:serine/threonine protein kinase
MSEHLSLRELHIDWEGSPEKWHEIPHTLLPKCSLNGIISDTSGNKLFTLTPTGSLGSGTFGYIDSFLKDGKQLAIKRPKTDGVHLFIEALIQWKTHKDLKPFGLEGCVPKVHDIFFYRPTSSVWFSMDMYDPILFSIWCSAHLPSQPNLFPYILLQLALILDVFEGELKLDHRDLKVNNMLIAKESFSVNIRWNHSDKKITFPFRIIFIDFGFACMGKRVDARDGLPVLDTCPKVGRDFFHILASIWSIPSLRDVLNPIWGTWVRSRLSSGSGSVKTKEAYVRLAESGKDIEWIHIATKDPNFQAPLCAPKEIISDCMRFIEAG